MRYKCLLVDDEPLALKVLESYIAEIPTLELAGKCSNAFEAMQLLQQTEVDIMFLDIKMPRLSGIEFLRSIKTSAKIILTTAYKEYALEGFEVDAVDYLLKPISLERFIKAISKIDHRSEVRVQEIPGVERKFLYFRVDRKMTKVFLDEIIYIESLKDYIKIVREKESPLLIRQTISSVEEMLPAKQFLRIHRSYIISIARVSSFTQKDVQLKGHEIPIGRGYQQSMKVLKK
jgi:DNA-binding LytR/AlgR family response regulator